MREQVLNLGHVDLLITLMTFTGITVKCHATRSLERNRKIARELMVQKMDDLLNGDDSIENQKKRTDEGKNRSLEAKRKKREALKLEWKKTEELDKVNDN